MVIDITRYQLRWLSHAFIFGYFFIIYIRALIYGKDIYERY